MVYTDNETSVFNAMTTIKDLASNTADSVALKDADKLSDSMF